MYEKFPKISFHEAMLKYGTDKPDLRNPLIINEITNVFSRDDVKFDIFKKLIKAGSIVKAITATKNQYKPRNFFDNIDKWAKDEGAKGLAYLSFENKSDKINWKRANS